MSKQLQWRAIKCHGIKNGGDSICMSKRMHLLVIMFVVSPQSKWLVVDVFCLFVMGRITDMY